MLVLLCYCYDYLMVCALTTKLAKYSYKSTGTYKGTIRARTSVPMRYAVALKKMNSGLYHGTVPTMTINKIKVEHRTIIAHHNTKDPKLLLFQERKVITNTVEDLA